ncbi:MAG TPA: glycosyltransferase, partial [Candidatus Lokiarchaeia archaeon]
MSHNILMIAYTNYTTDSRVIREAEAVRENGYEVDFIALKRENDTNREKINGINIYRVKQHRYRGKKTEFYIFSYIEFLIRCLFLVTILYMKKKYKVVHVNNMPDFVVFCAIVPKLFGAKIILDIHDSMALMFLTKFNASKYDYKYKM